MKKKRYVIERANPSICGYSSWLSMEHPPGLIPRHIFHGQRNTLCGSAPDDEAIHAITFNHCRVYDFEKMQARGVGICKDCGERHRDYINALRDGEILLRPAENPYLLRPASNNVSVNLLRPLS